MTDKEIQPLKRRHSARR
uniref:Uncharacterized protein n=1 Tax=Arundo donax TaxID=35708 RepID=A0A0A9ALU5_ARUDO